MSVRRRVRSGGLLVAGLVSTLGSCGLNVHYSGKVDDLQRGMPPAVVRAYEIENELNSPLPAREALDSDSATMSHYRALKMKYDDLMTQGDLRQQKEDYDRKLVDYRGLEGLGGLAIPFSLLFLAVGIASTAVYDGEIIAERIARFTGKTYE